MDKFISHFNQIESSGHASGLLQAWRELDVLCSERKATSSNPRKPSISYIIKKKNYMGQPTEFEIWYRCKSIVGVKDGPIPREPIFGYLHKMRIVLPYYYPSANGGNPMFCFITNVWHPNIRYSGIFKGFVQQPKEMGVLSSLTDYVLLIERYLKYEQYHAQNTYPYPEDANVAEWVREEGEPNGWTQFEQDTQEEESSKKV